MNRNTSQWIQNTAPWIYKHLHELKTNSLGLQTTPLTLKPSPWVRKHMRSNPLNRKTTSLTRKLNPFLKTSTLHLKHANFTTKANFLDVNTISLIKKTTPLIQNQPFCPQAYPSEPKPTHLILKPTRVIQKILEANSSKEGNLRGTTFTSGGYLCNLLDWDSTPDSLLYSGFNQLIWSNLTSY